MRLARLVVLAGVVSPAAVAAALDAPAAPVVPASTAGVEHEVSVLHGTQGTVLHLVYVPDQTYDVSVALGSLLQIDFPANEHIEHVVVSAAPAIRAQQVGDAVQVSAVRADAIAGVNILTTRGTYRLQVASTHERERSTGFVHFGVPGAER